MPITALYAAISALILVYLSFRVVVARRGEKVSVGTGGSARVERAMRTQANFTEYIPLTLLLIAGAELNGLPSMGVHGLGIAMVLARLMHFIGFSSESGPFQFRVGGTLLTFTLLLMLPIIVFLQSVGLVPFLTQGVGAG